MMRKIIVALLLIGSQSVFFGQDKRPIPGAHCKNCRARTSQTLSDSAGVTTKYVMSACGLNYVQSSLRLDKRPFTGMTDTTGVAQPAPFVITGIPSCATILKAYIWAGVLGNGAPVSIHLTNPVNTTSTIPMTIAGSDVDICWSAKGTFCYRADVTSMISGNGTYSVSGIPANKVDSTGFVNDADGATLLIIYSDNTQTYTGNIIIADGCQADLNGYMGSSISGFTVCGTPSLTTNFMVLCDLQQIDTTFMWFNTPSTTASNYNLLVANDSVWNFISAPVAPAAVGQTSANYGFSNGSDCFALMVAGMYYRSSCLTCQPSQGTYTVSSNGPLCTGATLSLSTNATSPYSWSGPNGFASSTQNPTIPNVSLAASGDYVLNLTGACSSATISVVVSPQPSVTIVNVTGSPSITCNTPTINLTGASTYTAGTLSYYWVSNSFTANTQSITVVNASTLITLTASDALTNCSATATIAIGINTTPPTSSVSPLSQVINCGVGVIATATGVAVSPTTNVTHLWYSAALPTNPVSSGGQTSIFAPTLGTNTFVLVNNINGCSTLKTITVTSTRGFPTFSVASSQNYSVGCTTRSLTNVQILNAQADSGAVVSYTILPPGYSGGATYSTSTSANVFTITTPGTYTVIVRDNNNHCETSIPVSIIQNTFAPDIQVSTLTRTLSCFTPSILLQGGSANSGFSTVTYTWSYQNGVNPGNVLSSSLAVNVNTAAPSSTLINTYTLAVYDQNNACTSTSVVPLYQNTSPPHPAIGVQSNIITCATPSINLTNASASGVPVPPFTNFQAQRGLYWTGPSPQLPDSNKSTYAAFTPGTYTMTTQDLNNGCTAVTTTLILDGRIYPVLITNTNVALDCDVATTGGVKLAVTVQSLSASQVSVAWALPQPPPNVNNVGTLTLTTDGAGEYTLSVTTTTNGCTSNIVVEVVPGALTATFTPDKETGFAPLTVNFTNNSSSTSTVNGTASVTSVWSFGNGTTRTTTTNVNTSSVYTAPGTYTVTMFASKGTCRDTVVKTIFVDIPSRLTIPNVFTPNGDNSNDIFFVQAANLTSISAQIFDRWGNLIYDITSTTGNIAWDGKNQSGKDVADGTYFYTIKATGKDGASYDYKGQVSLYR